MDTEYILSYTASEIDEALRDVGELNSTVAASGERIKNIQQNLNVLTSNGDIDYDISKSLDVQINGNVVWESGGFLNGAPVSNSKRIRTRDYIVFDRNISILAPEDTNVWVRCYRYGSNKTFEYINTIFTSPKNTIELVDYAKYNPTHFKIVAGNSYNSAVGDVKQLSQKIVVYTEKSNEAKFEFDQGVIESDTGNYNKDSKTRMATRNYIPISNNTYIKASKGRDFWLYFYKDNSGTYEYIAGTKYDWTTGAKLVDCIDVAPDATHFKFSVRYRNRDLPTNQQYDYNLADEMLFNETVDSIESFQYVYGARSVTPDLIEDFPKSTGVLNVLLRAKQFAGVEYTTKAGLPCLGYPDDIVPAGTKVTGVAYSSAKHNNKIVGSNVSLDTYVTAIYNPHSVIYKEKIEDSDSAKTYYGTVCSGFLGYCFGIPYTLTTNEFYDNTDDDDAALKNPIKDVFDKVVDVSSVQLGDFLHRNSSSGVTGHVMLITGIKRNIAGTIVEVEITDAIAPVPRVRARTWGQFTDEFKSVSGNSYGYTLYRYRNIDSVSYASSQYAQLFDETALYPDIITYYGDKATILVNPNKISVKSNDDSDGYKEPDSHLDNGNGVEITANILSATGYNTVQIYRNDEKIHETAIEVLDKLEDGSYIAKLSPEQTTAGKYEFRLVGENKQSSTYLIAVDAASECKVEKKTNDENYTRVTFGKSIPSTLANSTPICVALAGENFENINTIEISSEYVEKYGYIDIKTANYSTKHYIKVYFQNEFGTVAWVSENISTKCKWKQSSQ